ncbi:hypothetical protein [Streptomyces sp. NRRL F-2580]|uniref:hypothetical protein n=1 Tax=Streptomyces sp. NRRL F-2580 TaxID=1463841 RepID=UPI0004C6953B|nr:hypothetical protein [Streptomyces sp. NRRL F-2580]
MTARPVHFDGPGGDGPRRAPPMPARTPQGLRLALQEHAPHLPADFQAHWRRAVADAFGLAPVPAFTRLWWTQYALALARGLGLEAHLLDLETRAAQSEGPQESTALLAEYSRLRRQAAAVEPGR